MRWTRWNITTHIYEISTDNGQNWNPLDLDAAVLTEGTVNPARLGSGTPTGAKVLFGDSSWDTLVAGDIPDLDVAKITSGAFAKARQHTQTAYKDEANVFTLAGNSFSEILSVNKGIQFPAVQVASTDGNVLDDYEEGSWTPTFGGSTSESGQVYTIQVGRYIKIGKKVWATCRVQLSTLGTITGNVVIKGLPFTSENVSQLFGSAVVGFHGAWTTSIVWLAGHINPNESQIRLEQKTAASVGVTAPVQADLSNTSDVIVSVTFQAAA